MTLTNLHDHFFFSFCIQIPFVVFYEGEGGERGGGVRGGAGCVGLFRGLSNRSFFALFLRDGDRSYLTPDTGSDGSAFPVDQNTTCILCHVPTYSCGVGPVSFIFQASINNQASRSFRNCMNCNFKRNQPTDHLGMDVHLLQCSICPVNLF